MSKSTISLIVSVLLNVVLLLLLGWQFKNYQNPCPDEEIVRQWIDTVYVTPAKVKPSIVVKVPEAYRVITPKSPKGDFKSKTTNSNFSLIPAKGVVSVGSGSSVPAPVFSPCDETVEISDTTEIANDYRAIIIDTLNGNKIVGRGITFYNLHPIIAKHVEKIAPVKESIRVYLGITAGFEANYKEKRVSNFNLGPEIFITEPHGAMIGYGFDAKNNGHRLSFLYKIKLKK